MNPILLYLLACSGSPPEPTGPETAPVAPPAESSTPAPAAPTVAPVPVDGAAVVPAESERPQRIVVDEGCARYFSPDHAGEAFDLLAGIKLDCAFEGVFVESWKMQLKWEAEGGEVHTFSYGDARCLNDPWVTHEDMGLVGTEAGRAACAQTLARIESFVERKVLPIPQAP